MPLENLATFNRLIGKHSEMDLLEWAKQLRYFYIFGQISSGHAELFEMLTLRIKFNSNSDCFEKISKLVDLKSANKKESTIEIKTLYHSEDAESQYSTLINNDIRNSYAYLTLGDQFFDINLHGNGVDDVYDISRDTIKVALTIENKIDYLMLDKYVDHNISCFLNCISKVNFPEKFE